MDRDQSLPYIDEQPSASGSSGMGANRLAAFFSMVREELDALK